MAPRTATDVVILCENVLGFTHPTHKKNGEEIPLWKARATEAGKLKKKMAEKPALFTFENLELAVYFCQRQRKPVKSPAALCWIIPDALKVAADGDSRTVLTTTVDEAIEFELSNPELEQHDFWLRRLLRAQGVDRELTLQEWAEARNEYR